ncbi:MAG: PD40 domain-containing protein, partial [Bryobacterales bacterium]|nr:PD40 domain-containing protein [Bryobacterales bacterium]
GGLAALSDGLLMYRRRSALGAQFAWLDRTGKVGNSLGQPGYYVGQHRLSPDGRRVVVGRGGPNNLPDLWMWDMERDAWSRFTFLPGGGRTPVWSPDGKHVIFSLGSPANLYRKEASGAGTEQRVTNSANEPAPNDWSRDGRLVLFNELAPDTKRDLWVLPVTPDGKPEAGAQPRPYLRTPSNEIQGRFSPEPSPRWVAYTSDESGWNEIYIQAFPEPQGKFQISTGGGMFPEWSPDGRELFYVSEEGRLMAVGLNRGADSIAPSTPRELFTFSRSIGSSFPYAVAPDGKRFLVKTPVGDSGPLEVIVNWQALVKAPSGE